VGKYVELKDAYKSISDHLSMPALQTTAKSPLEWIHSESVNDDNVKEKFKGLRGILVAPVSDKRGIEGKITAIKYARENNVPFFGICLGMQCAVIEFARNVLGFKDANSTEMNPGTTNPVIDLLEAQKKITSKGGTMRLGAYPCNVLENTIAWDITKRRRSPNVTATVTNLTMNIYLISKKPE